jgi:hypothetical protein
MQKKEINIWIYSIDISTDDGLYKEHYPTTVPRPNTP